MTNTNPTAAQPLDLDRLEALARAATPGEWKREDRTVYVLEPDGWRKGIEQFRNRFSCSVSRDGSSIPQNELLANAEFIAAANPQTVLDLIAQARAQQAGAAPNALADAIQYLQNVAADAVPMLSHDWPKTSDLLKGAVAALAHQSSQLRAPAVAADDRTLPNLAILHDGIWYVPMHLVAALAPSDAKGKADAAIAGGRIAAYKLGDWFDAGTLDEMQAFYLSRLPAIREAAKEHGYAIGLHGSQRRDFDLMAMQWRDDASDKDTLAHAISVAACGITHAGSYQWETKPSGRFAVSMPICWTDHGNPEFGDMLSLGHIDLSVIDFATSAADAKDAALMQARDALNSLLWQFTGTPSTFRDSNARVQGHAAIKTIDAAIAAQQAQSSAKGGDAVGGENA